MIDIEPKVFTELANALRAEFSEIDVQQEYVNSPSKFPHVSIVEVDNYPSPDRQTNEDAETFATVTYEINVYSNKSGTKKYECRQIIKFIDKIMFASNFTRLALTPVPNQSNATIYRMTARYRAETDGTTLYRR